MTPDPLTDPPFDASGLKFALGAAFFGAAATSITIAIEEARAERASSLLDPSVVAIGLAAALFAFFASWVAYHWTRNNEPIFFRIISLTLLVPFLMFLALVPVGGLGGFALAAALVGFGFLKFGLAFVLATLVWSTVFLCLQSKRPS